MEANDLNINAHRLASLLKVIADRERLRILGLLAAEPLTSAEISARTQLPAATVEQHLRKLHVAGIVIATGIPPAQSFEVDAAMLLDLRRTPVDVVLESAPTGPGSPSDDSDRKVIRNFFHDNRLKSIPAKQQHKRIVLEHLVTLFEPDRNYPEREVNAILRESHEDVASIRRYMVDFGFMTREHGIYRVAKGDDA